MTTLHARRLRFVRKHHANPKLMAACQKVMDRMPEGKPHDRT